MLTIVWDVDDVLNDLMYQWFTCSWLASHPDCQVGYADLKANPPHVALGITLDEYLVSLDEFRNTEAALNFRPNPLAVAWFQSHGERFRHFALTARPLDTAPNVAYWVMQHFGEWIRSFAVVPSRSGKTVPVYDRSKGEYLKWLQHGHILVDDSAENIYDAEQLGMKVLLYPQPWNNSTSTVESLLQQLNEWAGAS